MTEPTAGTWHDLAPDVAEAARGLLRLSGTDPDLGRLTVLAPAACAAIDQFLSLLPSDDRVEYPIGGVATVTYASDDVPAEVLEAAVQLTGELFRRKDAPFGVLNATSPNGVPLYVSKDQMAGVLSLLAPYREGFGFA